MNIQDRINPDNTLTNIVSGSDEYARRESCHIYKSYC